MGLGWLWVEPESQSLAEPAMPVGSILPSHWAAKGLQGPSLEVSSQPFSPAWGPRYGDAIKSKRFAWEKPVWETGPQTRGLQGGKKKQKGGY